MHQQPRSMAAAVSKLTQAPRVAVAEPGPGRRDWASDYCARHEHLDDGGADLPRQVCQLALSFDHRLIDGDVGSRIAEGVKAAAESPTDPGEILRGQETNARSGANA